MVDVVDGEGAAAGGDLGRWALLVRVQPHLGRAERPGEARRVGPQLVWREAAGAERAVQAVVAAALGRQVALAQCGANASCKSVQLGIGICTYDD